MRPNQQSHQNNQPFKFHGLADAFGLESLLDFHQQQVFPLLLRTHIYSYRRPLFRVLSIKEMILTIENYVR